MESDRIATESVTALAPILTPHGRLLLEPADDAVALSADLSHRLQEAFARGSGHGLLQLGAAEVGTVLPAIFGYWREFGARYVSAVCGQEDLATSRSHTIIGPPPPGELEKLAAAAPPEWPWHGCAPRFPDGGDTRRRTPDCERDRPAPRGLRWPAPRSGPMGRTEPRHASPHARRVSRNRDRSQGEGPGFCVSDAPAGRRPGFRR